MEPPIIFGTKFVKDLVSSAILTCYVPQMFILKNETMKQQDGLRYFAAKSFVQSNPDSMAVALMPRNLHRWLPEECWAPIVKAIVLAHSVSFVYDSLSFEFRGHHSMCFDFPAIFGHRSTIYFLLGKKHRICPGPVDIRPGLSQEYYVFDVLRRRADDLPGRAVRVFDSGQKEFDIANPDISSGLKPVRIFTDGTSIFATDAPSLRHRNKFPAVINRFGLFLFYQHGELVREIDCS